LSFFHFLTPFSKSAYFFIKRKGLAQTFSKSAYFFTKRKGLAQTFQSPHIFSSSAKVWRKHFQSPHIFSSSAKVWRKHFQSAPIFSSDANNFKKRLGFHLFQTCRNCSSVFRFNFQSKICKEQSKVLKAKQKAKSSVCSPRALKNSFVKRM
jgi:hypothetical protein